MKADESFVCVVCKGDLVLNDQSEIVNFVGESLEFVDKSCYLGDTISAGMMRKWLKEKPAAAWLPEQVADHLLAAMERGDFYVLCPDNDVTREMDEKRVLWNTYDLIENRPALSRWHPDFEAAFEAFMKS